MCWGFVVGVELSVAISLKIRKIRVVVVVRYVAKWEPSSSKFNERDPERPYVRFNAVFRALYTLRLRNEIYFSKEVSEKWSAGLTLMYTEVPTNVLAMELISSPDTPKSHSLIWPSELRRTFEGLISIQVLSARLEISQARNNGPR